MFKRKGNFFSLEDFIEIRLFYFAVLLLVLTQLHEIKHKNDN